MMQRQQLGLSKTYSVEQIAVVVATVLHFEPSSRVLRRIEEGWRGPTMQARPYVLAKQSELPSKQFTEDDGGLDEQRLTDDAAGEETERE